MAYAGFYINLDRSTQRRAEIEGELARFGLQQAYRRFAAVAGNALGFPASKLKDGEIGCFSSHYQLLKENLGADRHLHVIEDDVIFAAQTAQVIDWCIDQGQLDRYDILYTDVAVPLLNDGLKAYKSFYDRTVARNADGSIAKVAFCTVDLRELIFASTSSFVINKASAQKLHDLYGRELASGATLPIDLFIRKQAQDGNVRVGCILPFVTSVRLEHTLGTSIEARHDALSVLAATIARASFFIGCDMAQCEDFANRYLKLPPQPSRHEQLLGHALAFSLTDAYRTY